jgi:hypothetical protein
MLLLSPAKLISIAPDEQLFERIRGFCKQNSIFCDVLEAHVEGSQWVLPRLATDNRQAEPLLDFALIDGCHGWPTCFVDLEYVNEMLKPDGYLLIDDTELHSVKEMARFLMEEPGFSLALDLDKSLIFQKRTAARHFGEWIDQPYIVRRSNEYARSRNMYALREEDMYALREETMFTKTARWVGRRLPQNLRERLKNIRLRR